MNNPGAAAFSASAAAATANAAAYYDEINNGASTVFLNEKQFVDRYMSIPIAQFGNQELFLAMALCNSVTSNFDLESNTFINECLFPDDACMLDFIK